jgi:hypothetical protein
MSLKSNHSKSPLLRRNQRLYRIWCNMKRRCDNPNDRDYKWYGSRGIKYDPTWISFEGFQKDMQNGYNDSLTIERIDNNKGYSKENCKWIPLKDQAKNTRNTENAYYIEYKGIRDTIRNWAKFFGIKRTTLGMRIQKYHMTFEEAIAKGGAF